MSASVEGRADPLEPWLRERVARLERHESRLGITQSLARGEGLNEAGLLLRSVLLFPDMPVGIADQIPEEELAIVYLEPGLRCDAEGFTTLLEEADPDRVFVVPLGHSWLLTAYEGKRIAEKKGYITDTIAEIRRGVEPLPDEMRE